MTNWENIAGKAIVNLIWVARSEADMGSVSGTMFDALGETYDDIKDIDPSTADEILQARKEMRQTEWGGDFSPEDYDLPLDPEWVE